MRIPGTRVTTVDTDTGIALVFETSGDVPTLQREVRARADAHNQRRFGDPVHGQGSGRPGVLPHARVTAQDIPSGARMVFTPLEKAQLDELREDVRSHATKFVDGTCPPL